MSECEQKTGMLTNVGDQSHTQNGVQASETKKQETNTPQKGKNEI